MSFCALTRHYFGGLSRSLYGLSIIKRVERTDNMRIAFIVDAFPVLSETFVLNQITGLMDLGHDIEIFAGARATKEMYPPEVEKYGLLKRTYYHNEKPRNIFTRFLKSIRLFVLNIGKNPLVILRSLNFFKYGKDALALTLLYKVVVFLNRGEFDIIQCHFGGNGNVGVLLKELGIQGKVVTMFHGYDIRRGINTNGKIYKRLFKKGDLFLSISAYNYKHLVGFGADPNKIVYHPVGIDLKRFSWGHERIFPKADETFQIATVARLIREKGLSYGIDAVEKVVKKNPGIKIEYFIIGEGPLREELEKLIIAKKLESVVHFMGIMQQENVVRVLRHMHLFLLPSIAEALPVVLMEAQALGLPIVATSVGSIDQVVLNGESAYLVNSKDPDAMAERIEYLTRHHETWIGMSRAGRKFVEEHYDIDKLNKRLVEIYKGALGGNE